MTDVFATETDLELIDHALADWGSIHRRAGKDDFTEEDFRGLMNRVRGRLKTLRASLLDSDEPAIVITDAGMAAAVACAVGQKPEIRALIRRVPGLMTAQRLAEHPGVGKARVYGNFAAIEGDRP